MNKSNYKLAIRLLTLVARDNPDRVDALEIDEDMILFTIPVLKGDGFLGRVGYTNGGLKYICFGDHLLPSDRVIDDTAIAQMGLDVDHLNSVLMPDAHAHVLEWDEV